jgi:hypothetical protein
MDLRHASHGTARGVAGFYDHLLRAGDSAADPLLDPGIVAEAVRPQRRGPDLVLGQEAAWGLGFRDVEDGSYGMGGLGGGVGVASHRLGYAFGFITRRMGDHDRAYRLEQALISCLG